MKRQRPGEKVEKEIFQEKGTAFAKKRIRLETKGINCFLFLEYKAWSRNSHTMLSRKKWTTSWQPSIECYFWFYSIGQSFTNGQRLWQENRRITWEPFSKNTWLPYVFWKMSQMIDTASPPFHLIWKITAVDYGQPLMNSEQGNE